MQLSTIRRFAVAATVSLVAFGCPPEGGENGDDGTGSDTGPAPDTGATMDGSPEDTVADTTSDTSEDDTVADTTADTTSDTQEEDADGGSSLTLRSAQNQVASLIAEGRCAAAFSCPQKVTGAGRKSTSRSPDESACRDYNESLFAGEDVISSLESDLQKGLTTFNEQKARQCIQELQDRVDQNTCRNLRLLLHSPNVCDGVIEGAQAQGEPCKLSRHCASGRCDRSANPNECYGACGASTREEVDGGELCGGFDKSCNSDKKLVCVRRDPTDTTTEQVCKTFASKSMGETCGSPFRCASGLNCIDNECTALTIKGQGESCGGQTEACEVGLACTRSISGSGSNETVSFTCDTAGTAGADCYFDRECQRGLYCAGETYAPNTGDDSVVGSCKDKKPEGESCSSGLECESSNCDSGTCAERSIDQCEVPASG